MPTLDAQLHAYERNHPGRPWAGVLHGPAEVTGDQMVAAMDAVGVDGAVLVSPFAMYRYDASYAIEVYAAHPTRFRLVKPVDPADPAVADTIADWTATEGTVGIRIMLRDEVSTDPADPGLNRVLAAAAQHSLPVNLLCWGRLEQAAELAARNPNTRLVIDHLGLQQPFEPPPLPEPFADLPKVLALAAPRQYCDKDQRRLHIVARTVPLQRHLGSARPHIRRLWFRSLHVGHRLDARGRIVDLRAGGRVTDRLSDSDRAVLMGETLQRVYNWSPSQAARLQGGF
jgi:L-fuconolactonase